MNRSGADPALMPNAVRNASRCGTGKASRPSSIGAHSWCSPAKASSIAGLHADRACDPAPSRLAVHIVEQRRLAYPRLPAHHQRPALTGANGTEELVKHAAFTAPIGQPLRDRRLHDRRLRGSRARWGGRSRR